MNHIFLVKKHIFVLIFLSFFFVHADAPLVITITAEHAAEKMNLALCAIQPDESLLVAAARIQHNLSCQVQKKSGFVVHSFVFDTIPARRNIKNFFKEGIPLVVLIKHTPPDVWHCWVYDAASLEILESKKIHCSRPAKEVGDLLSDILWEILTGQEGIFSTRIAFCKEFHVKNGTIKHLCVSAPQDTRAIPVVKKGKPIAPRWHPDPLRETIFYSSITNSNISLKAIDLQGRSCNVSNFDGINLLPSFSQNGKKMVYCRSDEQSVALFSCTQQPDGTTACNKLPIPPGNTISPVVLDNGDIIFCSDAKANVPRIYCYHEATGAVECLTPGAYAVAPAWCGHTNQLAYCKLVGGVMQIFVLDIASRKERQITSTAGDKDECSWSPHGNYVVYTHNQRIAIRNMSTQEQWYITEAGNRCSYPAWSPRFLRCSV